MKKDKIYKAALELFVKSGIDSTPTSAIAEKAGVANGTLFHYFKTKEALVLDLYLEIKDNFLIYVTERYYPDKAFADQCREIWLSCMEWAIENQIEFIFTESFRLSRYWTKLTAENISRHRVFFLDIMKEGVEKNIFKRLPVDLLLEMNLQQISGIISYLLMHPQLFHEELTMSMLLESCWGSLKI
jgi:AcrR family transcriptional regulator